MKNLKMLLLLVVCLAASAMSSNAQTAAIKDTATAKNILAEIARRKAADKPFKLNEATANELLIGEANALSSFADACDTATPISIGQSVGATISGASCRLDDGSYANFYVFSGTQGQKVTIQMYSSSIDSYLGLANESGTFVIEDDDSGGGLGALITATLPASGSYLILANTALPNQFGGYTLRLSGAAPCTFSATTNITEVPASGGTFTFNVNTQPECQWRAYSATTFITTNSTGNGAGTGTFTVAQNGSGQTRQATITISSVPLETLSGGFAVPQPSVACTYSLSPASINLPAQAATGSFSIIAPAGCPWSSGNGAYVNSNSSGTGNGTINYSIMHNNGAARQLYVNVGGLTFVINQAGLNCDFRLTPNPMTIGRQGGTRTINVSVQPGCIWSPLTNSTFLTVSRTPITGAGTVTVTVQPQTETRERSGAVQFEWGTGSGSVWIDQSGKNFNSAMDFDGDNKADIAVYRPSSGVWYANRSAQGFAAAQFGTSGDRIVPADYDGDGKTDFAVYRPSSGTWFWINSSNNTISGAQFGATEDIPAPADYDGDGRADLTVFRPSNGTWYQQLSVYGFRAVQFGAPEDKPTVGDFDNDGRADIAVFRSSNSVWYRLSSGSNNAFYAVQFGVGGDQPVASDYDGDGKTDLAVYRPSNNVWYRLNSSNDALVGVGFGIAGDVPAPADYDGDGRADIAVFRPSNSTWYQQNSTLGFAAVQFGASEDVPTAAAFVR